MAENRPNENRVELLQGTLDTLILRTLQWGPQHGHGIGQAIRRSSADLLQIERGSLYPALHRLNARGLITSEWKASELNRRAKYYRLTAAGRKQLVTEQSKWKLLVRAIGRVMRPALRADRGCPRTCCAGSNARPISTTSSLMTWRSTLRNESAQGSRAKRPNSLVVAILGTCCY